MLLQEAAVLNWCAKIRAKGSTSCHEPGLHAALLREHMCKLATLDRQYVNVKQVPEQTPRSVQRSYSSSKSLLPGIPRTPKLPQP